MQHWLKTAGAIVTALGLISGLVVSSHGQLRADIRQISSDMADVRERLARIEERLARVEAILSCRPARHSENRVRATQT